jgi:hypothetical protein
VSPLCEREEADVSDFETYLWVALGVALSVIIPIVWGALRKNGIATESWIRRALQVARPYALIGVFSLLVSVIIVAVGGDMLDRWQAAVLAGYAWDSTLQKLKDGGRG